MRRALADTARGQSLLLALSHAAQAVQRARTPDEVYRSIGEQIRNLGYHCAVLVLTEDETYLTPVHMTFVPGAVRAAFVWHSSAVT
jgi:hypothetical protein